MTTVISLSTFALESKAIIANSFSCNAENISVNYSQVWVECVGGGYGDYCQVPELIINAQNYSMNLRGNPDNYEAGDVKMHWTGNGYLILAKEVVFNAPNINIPNTQSVINHETWLETDGQKTRLNCKVGYRL